MPIILFSLLVILIFNIILSIPAYFLKTDYLTDIAYCMSFVIITSYMLEISTHYISTYLVSLCIYIWAFRLGGYLLYRIIKIKKDKRFDHIRKDLFRVVGFWILQGVSAWIIMIPVILMMSKSKFVEPSMDFSFGSTNWWSIIEHARRKFLGLRPFIESNINYMYGLLIFLLGLSIETIADYQKYIFKTNKGNKDKWIQTGLWRYIRHPNYLGEILVWVGIYGMCLVSLSIRYRFIGMISPLYIIFILTFVSGIPLLEKKADAKWSKIKAYQDYKNNTYKLIPFVF